MIIYVSHHSERWSSWFKAPVLKTGDVKASVGSNPTLSAKIKRTSSDVLFILTKSGNANLLQSKG